MKNVAHIFFDLDHTIWDFEANSTETLGEIYDEFGLDELIGNKERFLATYQTINAQYWRRYNQGKIDKNTVRYGRFTETLSRFKLNAPEELGNQIADEYVTRSPRKTNLFPHAHETLEYLHAKYPLHIITNGFKEVQHIKIGGSKLDKYFDIILCSEEVGVNKPHRKVFERALEMAKVDPANAVMIGDNFDADIRGAEKAGLKAIHFDPKGERQPPHSSVIHSLLDLKDIF